MNTSASNHSLHNHSSSNNFFSSIGRVVLAHRRIVILIWVIVFLAGGFAASRVVNRLSYNFATPGQPGYVASQKILQHFGNGGQNAPAITVIAGVDSSNSSTVGAALEAVAKQYPSIRFVDSFNAPGLDLLRHGNEVVYLFTGPPTSLAPSSLPNQITAALAHDLPSLHVALTGETELAAAGKSSGLGVLAETIVAGVGALAILAFVFASVLAVIPLVIAAVSILATFLILLGLSYVTQVSFVVEFLVSLIGLGIAIDYSLLIVTRWREERGNGLANRDAILMSMATAGRSVALSGVTVGVGLLALIVLPVPLLRSTGIGGVLIPVISITVVLTLLPVLLSLIGERLDWPHRRIARSGSPSWHRIGEIITGHAWPSLIIAGGLVIVFALPVLGIRLGQDQATSQSSSTPASVAYHSLLGTGYTAGILTPIEVISSPAKAAHIDTILHTVPGIVASALPAGRSGTRTGLADTIAIPNVETVNSATFAPVNAVTSLAKHDPSIIGVSGLGANDLDSAHAIYGQTPLMLAVIAILTFILLSTALKSIVLAIKAVVVNLFSLAATFGILTWFWQSGHLSRLVFGIPATGAITFWIPISIFAFLFGLSMDYEVFILTRIREEYDTFGSTRTAIVNGLSRTGKLVTSAAIILFLAFASLASAPLTDIRVLATGLGIGILVDATIIRGIAVPALIQLFGRTNWWMPTWWSEFGNKQTTT
ncbi:MMPL family transporter [Ferrimicrobium acidiphilum]|uniref:MMPL family transporter n=2 Tax=Ferrimicrobium acidiphilum TaxID=121039 RepID=UPI0023EF803A|nr:MMPL family transporter [Ferrimicrobium acidiphilum]